jgi:Flp pilus assembly protein CpaB
MNTKKIWMISLILGIVVAAFAYLTIFSKDKISSAAGIQNGQEQVQKKDDPLNKQIEAKNKTETKKKQYPERQFSNPLVDVSEGKRAISINVDLEQGVSGYIQPNSKVDVIAYETSKDDKTKKEFKSASVILENIKVLSSGKSSDNKADALQYNTVTLEVTPAQGVMLSLAAKDKDGFYLMLRNLADTGTGTAGLKQTREVIKEGGQ